MINFIKLVNDYKTEVTLCNIGASIYDIRTVDCDNNLESIVYTTQDKYEFPYDGSYFGKTLGRTAGRIENKYFKIKNRFYKVDSSDPNGLHGGSNSLSFRRFDFKTEENNDYSEVNFMYISRDGESGYPGEFNVEVCYRLYKKINKLEIIYSGVSKKDTLANLSNHTYFNLSGNAKRDILNHELFINSSRMERIEKLIPREIVDCKEIYSFKRQHKIGDYLFDKEIIDNTNGYDFPYLFDEVNENIDQMVLSDKISKRFLKVRTSYPCAVIYTCNYVGNETMNNGAKAKPYYAVCLECSFLPNSVNSSFIKEKKDILKAKELYNQKIEFYFGVEK